MRRRGGVAVVRRPPGRGAGIVVHYESITQSKRRQFVESLERRIKRRVSREDKLSVRQRGWQQRSSRVTGLSGGGGRGRGGGGGAVRAFAQCRSSSWACAGSEQARRETISRPDIFSLSSARESCRRASGLLRLVSASPASPGGFSSRPWASSCWCLAVTVLSVRSR